MKEKIQQNDKIMWFEWAMLFIAIGIIFVSVFKVEADRKSSKAQLENASAPGRTIEVQPVGTSGNRTLNLWRPQSQKVRFGYPAPSKDWSNLGIHDVNFQQPDIPLPDVTELDVKILPPLSDSEK